MSSYYRQPQYLSPSSYKIWTENRVQFYQYYLSPRKLPRDPQNEAMAIGSAFDAFIKSKLHKLYVDDNDPKYEFKTLFEAQVEEHNRAKAMNDGLRVYQSYIDSGALQDWQLRFSNLIGKPRFELDLHGIVDGAREGISQRIGAVPLLGKPDLYFTMDCHNRVISDWKVNGFYSKSGVSPKSGYVKIYPGCVPYNVTEVEKRGRLDVNKVRPMNQIDSDWAAQLCIYSWILGEPVGGDFLTMIHQIVCRPSGIRVAEHCAPVDPEFQHKLFEGIQDCWYRIQDGLIFDDMNAEESLAYAKSLDEAPPLTKEQLEMLRPQTYWSKKS